MATQQIEVRRWAAATPEAVFAVLADARAWPSWSPIGAAELERPGTPTEDGVGAIRRFTTGRITSREEVVAFEPGRHLAYVLLSGLAVRDYRADITLEPVDGGTAITWRSTFRAKVPGTGGAYRRQLERFIGQVADGLAERAAAGVRPT